MQKKTVLIADNSLICRTQLAGILSSEYEVIQASNGIEVLELLREKPNDVAVLVLDLLLSKKDGFQVLVEKAFDRSIVGIPTVAVSADSKPKTELRALNAGAIDFLSKPYEPEIALRRIKLAIEQRELEALHIQNRIYEEQQNAIDRDALTGIYSKTAFFRETRTMLDNNPNDQFFILRGDIEKFKLFNTLFGFDVGDRVLRRAAELLKRHMKGRGTYGRFESDIFMACLRGSREDVLSMMESIDADIRSSYDEAGLAHAIIIAVGVYPVEDHDLPVNLMCDRAAMAQRTIKGDYTRHIAFYDENLHKQLLEEQDIINNMERALAEGEFEVYLQPVYSMASGEVASAEALVRWNRPGRGIISPAAFIPLFERNGFISSLDRHMWEQVCRLQRERSEQGLEPLPISVNISRKSLYNPFLADEIAELTNYYEVDPNLFRIEITESAYMDNAEQLVETVEKLQGQGFLVLMDDFGSGYSSLNTLKDIPVDRLKLDMRFMEGFDAGGRVGTVMVSVLRLAKWLGVPVIAEGVETYDQYQFLHSTGCEYAQGFYLARPMPYSDFEEHLAEHHGTPEPAKRQIAVDVVNQVMGGDKLTPLVAHCLFDGFAAFEYDGTNLETLRADDGFFELFGYDINTFRNAANMLKERLSSEDYEHLLAACDYAVETGMPGRTLITLPETGEGILLTCMSVVEEDDNRSLLFIGFLSSSSERATAE